MSPSPIQPAPVVPEKGAPEVVPGVPPGRPDGRMAFASRWDLFLYMFLRIRETRRYWLIPVLLFVGLLGLMVNLFTGHNVLPAIYSLIP